MTIHGFLTTTDDFGRLNQYLDHYDEIAVVQIPGHNGKTNFSLFTMQSTINTVLSTFDTLAKKHDQVDVIGFSMGGACAARMSVERKDAIKKLVLMSPAGDMYEILNFVFSKNPVVDENFVDIGGYYVGKGFLESFKDLNMYEGLADFDKPVLITQGSADLSVYPEVSKKYTNYYKDVKYVLIDGASHCYTKVPYRKQINEEIKNFLTK